MSGTPGPAGESASLLERCHTAETLRSGRALAFARPDFEDAVCAAAAEATGCDAVVTRDPEGYPAAPLPVIEPAAALSWIADG